MTTFVLVPWVDNLGNKWDATLPSWYVEEFTKKVNEKGGKVLTEIETE